MFKKVVTAFLLVTVSLVTACGGDKTKNPRYERFQEPVQPLPYSKDQGAQELNRFWKEKISVDEGNTYSKLKPVIVENRVIVPSNKGFVSAFALQNGKRLWRKKFDTEVFAGVDSNKGLVALSLKNGVVVLLNAESGDTIWQQPAGRQIAASPVISDELVIVRTIDGLLLALDINSGQLVWQQQLKVDEFTLQATPEPVVVNNVILVGMADGVLAAVRVEDGSIYWLSQINQNRQQQGLQLEDIVAPPLVSGNLVIASTYGEQLSAFRLQSSQLIWQLPVSTYQRMQIQQGQLFMTDELGGIAAINAVTGDLLWQQNAFRGRGVSYPVALEERIVVGDNAGRLHLLDKLTGGIKQSIEVSKGAIRHLLVAQDRIILFTSSGELLVYEWIKADDKANIVAVTEIDLSASNQAQPNSN